MDRLVFYGGRGCLEAAEMLGESRQTLEGRSHGHGLPLCQVGALVQPDLYAQGLCCPVPCSVLRVWAGLAGGMLALTVGRRGEGSSRLVAALIF